MPKKLHAPIQFLVAAVSCLALSGCILQSKEPLFTDEQGELMLAKYGSRFASYSLDNGNWKKDEETISFTPVNEHYVASIGDDKLTVTFVGLSQSWWAVQGQEEGKPFNYYLAYARSEGIFLYPLGCKELQDAAKFGSFIDFKDGDCTVKDGVVKDGALALAMMFKLSKEPGEPEKKLVPLP